ncbi:MAG: glycosyltransferase family 2 protein [Acidaminococcaceae bacterium]|nr:glycosyltransferase family 2 protein [Acidaminococcaceae bacterium]
MLFSILIPVYNSALYIEQCIRSIKAQSYKKFECIIVNDGSTDNSLELISDIIENDTRFTVISQRNKGISDTRNKLLEMSKGEYIVWVDSDDFVDVDLLYNLRKEISQNGDDAYSFNYICVEGYSGKLKTIELFKKQDTLTSKDILKQLAKEVKMPSFLWNKVIKKDLYDGLRFSSKKVMLEDYEILTSVFLKVNKMVVINNSLYFYRQNSNSITHNVNIEIISENNSIIDRREQKILASYPDLLNEIKIGRAYRAFSYLTFLRKICDDDKITQKEQKNLRKYLYLFLLDEDINVKKKLVSLLLSINLRIYDVVLRLFSKGCL